MGAKRPFVAGNKHPLRNDYYTAKNGFIINRKCNMTKMTYLYFTSKNHDFNNTNISILLKTEQKTIFLKNKVHIYGKEKILDIITCMELALVIELAQSMFLF